MKAAPFNYVRAETLAQALDILAEHGEGARILSGGQSLAPALNLRLAAPELIVDIGGLAALRYISFAEGRLRIGALTRHIDLLRSEEIARHCSLLTSAVAHVAHPAIRNRGTIGGSLAHADPAAELPACMLALDATIVVTGPASERRIAARDFFLGVYETALRPGEVLTSIDIKGIGSSKTYGFAELARRPGDFAIVGLALAADRRGTTLSNLRLAFFGVGERPTLATLTAATLEGKAHLRQYLDAAQAALREELNPFADAHATIAMRRHLAGVLLERVLQQALETPA